MSDPVALAAARTPEAAALVEHRESNRPNGRAAMARTIGPHPANAPTTDDAPHPASTAERGVEPRECWHRADFTEVVNQYKSGELKRPQPTMLHRSDGLPILYAGKDHALIGASESGKSWVALVAALEVYRAGGAVVWADWEDDEETFLLRWVAIGGDPGDLLPGRLSYIVPEGDPGTWPELVAGAALVVIDTVEESAATMGYQTNERHEYSHWNRTVVRCALDASAAVLILDHVAKSRGDGPPREAIGTVAKLNKIRGAVFMLETVTPFGRGKDGKSRLTISKDRGGALGEHSEGKRRTLAEVTFTSTGDGLSVALDPPPATTTDSTGTTRRTGYMERISLWAEREPSYWSKAAAERGVGGTARYVGPAVDALHEEGYLTTEIGPGGHTVYASVKQFREADDLTGPAGGAHGGGGQDPAI
jgi:hypothetical protein